MSAAVCFRCLPKGMVRQVWTYLLCQWANKNPTPPPLPFSYSPDTAIITWTDINGAGQNGNLAFFNATADIASVSAVDLSGQPVTSVSNLSSLPALVNLNLGATLLTSLDVIGCSSLTGIVTFNSPITSLDVHGLIALQFLNCNGNPLTSLNVSGCTGMTLLDCGNTLLTSLDVSGLVSLNDLECYQSLLTSLNLTGCAALTIITAYSNALTTCNISASPLLSQVDFTSNQLTVLAVNTILDTLANNGVTGGTVSLSGQTPAAPPSVGPPDGIAAKATLQAEVPSWNVFTD